ncbi:MAG TPA: glucose 1-dehydrogenase [Chloroflexota bacterium]
MPRLEGKKAIVTGGARGIGRAIALRYADEGADVLVADLDGEGAERVAAEVRARGRSGVAVQVDVADVAQVATMVARAVEAFGRLDVLVNNAGTVQARRLLDITPEDWRRVFAVNVDGLFFCLQAAARQMVRQGIPPGGTVAGKIVNMSSNAGRSGRPLMAHYAASKAAVISITQSAALALAPHKITVNAICPGVVDTPLWRELDRQWSAIEGWPEGEAWRRRISTIPLGRPETPEDVAGVAAFLASSDADYMTGQALNICGGLVFS